MTKKEFNRLAKQEKFIDGSYRPMVNYRNEYFPDFLKSICLEIIPLTTFDGKKINRVTFDDGEQISWFIDYCPTTWLDWSEETIDEKYPD